MAAMNAKKSFWQMFARLRSSKTSIMAKSSAASSFEALLMMRSSVVLSKMLGSIGSCHVRDVHVQLAVGYRRLKY